MSELISLGDTSGSQQGRVFGRRFPTRRMQTGCVSICARVPGCSASGYDLPPLLLGLADFVMTVSHGLGPREFHLVSYGC